MVVENCGVELLRRGRGIQVRGSDGAVSFSGFGYRGKQEVNSM
jgi:hypothetical protein